MNYTANPRGRAFWAELGWTDTGEWSIGPMPPHAEQLILERPRRVPNVPTLLDAPLVVSDVDG